MTDTPERPWIEGLAYLKTRECLELLATRELGRVGFSIEDCPVILPVNYRIIANAVVFRTDPGAKLTSARQLSVSPWVPGSREHFVVIAAEQVSGRRFGPEARDRRG
jgi:uncharacterized protein